MASWLERHQHLIIIALSAVLAAAVVVLIFDRRGGPQPLEIRFGEPTPPGGSIEVHITGAVAHPGVYEIEDGDRVIDLLQAAGGQSPDADLKAINLAQRLHDEAQVIVPSLGQPSSDVAGVFSGTVNINIAPEEELDALPGIGEEYSRRIIESRASDEGPFASTEELVERRVIPRATYEQIRNLITVGP